jgi:hypothetical protein
MSNADRIRVSIVLEGTGGTDFGVTPASPAMLVLPTTGQSLRPRVGYQQSQTIRSDRNVSDFIRLSLGAGGGLPCELTYSSGSEALATVINAALCQTIGSVQTHASATTNAAARTITAAAVTGIEVGDIILLSGATPPGDNGYHKVTIVNVGTSTITVERATNFTGSAGNVTITRGARAKNGTTENSYTIEVARLDIQRAQIFTGCVINGMSFNIADEAITTANFDIVAKNATWVNAVSPDVFITGATYTSPAANPVLDSIGVPEIQSGGVDYAAKSINISLSNNAAARTQIGALGAQSMRFGQFSATGRITGYLDTPADLELYTSNTPTDLWLVMIDPNNRGYSISFPQVKYTDAGADTRGPNQDDFKELAMAAYLDPVEACTVRWQRWD